MRVVIESFLWLCFSLLLLDRHIEVLKMSKNEWTDEQTDKQMDERMERQKIGRAKFSHGFLKFVSCSTPYIKTSIQFEHEIQLLEISLKKMNEFIASYKMALKNR